MLLLHDAHHLGHIAGGGLRVLPEGSGIDEIRGISGDVCDRGEVDIDPQVQKGHAFLVGVLKDQVHPTLGEQGLGSGLPLGKEVWIAAGPHHRAALLIGPDQQGDARGVLIALDVIPHLLGCLVLEIPAEQQIAPQLILGGQLGPAGLRAADKKHLPDLFLQGHGGQQLLNDLLLVLGAQRGLGGLLTGGRVLHGVRIGLRRGLRGIALLTVGGGDGGGGRRGVRGCGEVRAGTIRGHRGGTAGKHQTEHSDQKLFHGFLPEKQRGERSLHAKSLI